MTNESNAGGGMSVRSPVKGMPHQCLAACGLLFLAIHAARAEPWIVHNGQPRAEIIVSETPPRMIRLAAVELQARIEQISGALAFQPRTPAGAPRRLERGRLRAHRLVPVARPDDVRKTRRRVTLYGCFAAMFDIGRRLIYSDVYQRSDLSS